MKKILVLLGFLIIILPKLFSFEALATVNNNLIVQKIVVDCHSLEDCQSLENQAQQLYQQGEFNRSLLLLEEISQIYKEKNNKIGRIRVFRNQALIYVKQQEFAKAKTVILSSLELFEEYKNTAKYQQLYASVLDIQAQIQLLTSQPELALSTWKQSAKIYQDIGKTTEWTRTQVNQAQALLALGLYSQALDILTETEKQLILQPDNLIKAKSLQSLGDVLRELGNLDLSIGVLNQSLVIARDLEYSEQIGITLISLAQTYTSQNQLELADKLYQEVIESPVNPSRKIEATLNQIDLLIQQNRITESMQLVIKVEKLLTKISASKVLAYAQINLANHLIQLRQKDNSLLSLSRISQHLTTAIKTAQSLQDKRSEAYGMGLLGKLYQQNQQLEEAQRLTRSALQITQAINAYDIAYQWQWQLGQILKAQNQPKLAIKAYTQAWKNLQSLRSDLVAINSEIQFNFREKVEPVYRELVDLLLSSNPTQDELKQARDVIESLQLAELDNFFRNACLDAKPINIDAVDPAAAIFYTISLKDRLELIVTLPNQPLVHYTAAISRVELETIIAQMKEAILIPRERIFIENFLEPSQQLYQYFIQPFEQVLTTSNIRNLVFILDSGLRQISLASLYDGQQYLIEKYNIAIAPGLQLINPQPITQKQLNVLAGGLTVPRQGFAALPNVELELQQIKTQTKSKILLNDRFTEPQFNREVNQLPFSIVHLATHGNFSSQLKDTFILTWNEKINIEELRNLLQTDAKQLNPIELLVLSACQTATGDERAGLGLAGVAVRSGARSTLASLWSVDDQSTALLMSYFYQELSQSKQIKAEALRQAQLKVLQQEEFAHPFFWAAFVLVGNWL
ncbi:MAG: CHAT domain-containing protein [Microcoleaceae cyanobacterium]